MYPANNNTPALNGWIGRMWKKHKKKILGAAAALIGGPIGLVAGALIQLIPDTQIKSQMSGIEIQAYNWINGPFQRYYLAKVAFLKGKDLKSPQTVNAFNRLLAEMGLLAEYYKVVARANPAVADLALTKSDIVKEATDELRDMYYEGLAKLNYTGYKRSVYAMSRPITGAPDTVNWMGQTVKVLVPQIGLTAQTIGDHIIITPGELPKPTLPPVTNDNTDLEVFIDVKPDSNVIIDPIINDDTVEQPVIVNTAIPTPTNTDTPEVSKVSVKKKLLGTGLALGLLLLFAKKDKKKPKKKAKKSKK